MLEQIKEVLPGEREKQKVTDAIQDLARTLSRIGKNGDELGKA